MDKTTTNSSDMGYLPADGNLCSPGGRNCDGYGDGDFDEETFCLHGVPVIEYYGKPYDVDEAGEG